MNCYVDSSVVLRYLLQGDKGLSRVKEFKETVSSELLYIECSRVLQRYRLEGLVSDKQLEEVYTHFQEIYDAFTIIEMSRPVKKRSADSFPTILGTLDAIHLSTAVLWAEQDREPLVLFTFDEQMKICAHAMGMHTIF